MRTDLFDFELPEDLIALRPVHPRDAARLLVVKPGAAEAFADKMITDLPSLIAPGDALVFNDTRVIPAALKGVRVRGEATAQISANLIERLDDHRWEALAKPGKRLEPGDRIGFGDGTGDKIPDLQFHVQMLLDKADEYRPMTPEERNSEPIAEMRRALAAEFRRLRAALDQALRPDGRATG